MTAISILFGHLCKSRQQGAVESYIDTTLLDPSPYPLTSSLHASTTHLDPTGRRCFFLVEDVCAVCAVHAGGSSSSKLHHADQLCSNKPAPMGQNITELLALLFFQLFFSHSSIRDSYFNMADVSDPAIREAIQDVRVRQLLFFACCGCCSD